MANPFFGKRDTAPLSPNASSVAASSRSTGFLTPATAPAPTGSARPASSAAGESTSSSTAAAAQGAAVGSSAAPASTGSSAAPASTGSTLTVGPNIKLKGVEITDCDTLLVQGTVQASMHSRVMHIAEQGAFSGSADIAIAEIHGTFDGDLTVREQLLICSTGRVSGQIRCGTLVVHEGGQLRGDVQMGAGSVRAAAAAAAAPAVRVAA